MHNLKCKTQSPEPSRLQALTGNAVRLKPQILESPKPNQLLLQAYSHRNPKPLMEVVHNRFAPLKDPVKDICFAPRFDDMMALLARKNPHFSQVVAVDAGFDPCLDCLAPLMFLFISTLLLRVCTVDLGVKALCTVCFVCLFSVFVARVLVCSTKLVVPSCS